MLSVRSMSPSLHVPASTFGGENQPSPGPSYIRNWVSSSARTSSRSGSGDEIRRSQSRCSRDKGHAMRLRTSRTRTGPDPPDRSVTSPGRNSRSRGLDTTLTYLPSDRCTFRSPFPRHMANWKFSNGTDSTVLVVGAPG
jgi:hypothetical protein